MADYINVQINSDNETCLGSAVIQEQVTDVINVGYYLSAMRLFADHGIEDFSDNAMDMDAQKHILIVDDSPFFRNMLAQF